MGLDNLDFDKSGGLIPAIIQDERTMEVLMLGYMNEEALQTTVDSKRVTFFSRSKSRLWTKGETSGNFLNLVSIEQDCDKDTLLIKAIPEGAVCHTGRATCFGESSLSGLPWLSVLEGVIKERRNESVEKSYTASLFKDGINRMAQKVGEEGVEVAIAASSGADNLLDEVSDLFFHTMVLLQAKDLSLDDVANRLKERNAK